MQNPSPDQTIAKLKKLVSSRFGKDLLLRRLTDASLLNEANAWVVSGEDLHIPLKIDTAYLGTAVIPEGADLPEENRLQIAQVIRMVLEPQLYRDFLERTETNLRLRQDDIQPPPFPTDELFSTPTAKSLPVKTPKLVSHLIHLHAHDNQRVKKSALLLHEMTGRWAFAPFFDLSHQLECLQDLRKLGAMTLFIEDVEALHPRYQELILDYLSTPRFSEDPLLITASTKGADALNQSEALLSDFKDELLVNTLELDRAPLTERGLREVLTLMFFEAQES